MILRSSRKRLEDLAILATAFCLTLIFCVKFSTARIFWSDELFGWMLLKDPSFQHMLKAWRAGADGGGILFYFLGRGWFFLFGPSEMSFRLFSALGIYVGFAAVWVALVPFYPRRLLVPLLFAVWFGTSPTLVHIDEGRFYGMLLGGAGLAFLTAVRLSTQDQVRLPLLGGSLAATLVLVGAHPLGLVYSGVLLAAVVIHDIFRRRFRPLVYTSVLAGWSLLLFSREALRNSAAVGKPHFWTVRPHLHDLRMIYSQGTHLLSALWILSIAMLLLAILLRYLTPRSAFEQLGRRAAVLFPTAALLLVPCLIWIASRRGTSLFTDRYLLPLDIGLVSALTGLLVFGLTVPRWPSLVPAVGTAIVWLMCLASLANRWRQYGAVMVYPPYDFTQALARMIPDGVPAVVERADVADLMWVYQPKTALSTFYLLDWDTAMAPESPRGDVSGFHEMSNWRRLGYFSRSIQDSDEFLKSRRDFVVVDDVHEQWFERNIQGGNQWQTELIGVFVPEAFSGESRSTWTAKIWRVHHR